MRVSLVFMRLVCMVSSMFWAFPVLADSLEDWAGAREEALGGTVRADAYEYAATFSNPSGLALSSGFVAEGGYRYRFRSRDDGYMLFTSSCDAKVRVAGCLYYRYASFSALDEAGAPSFSVHEFGITLGQRLWNLMTIGTTTKYAIYSGDLLDDSDQGVVIDLGMTLIAIPFIQIGVVGHNLLFRNTNDYYQRGLGIGVAAKLGSRFTFIADSLWTFEANRRGPLRFGGGLEFLAPTGGSGKGFPLRFGTLRDRAEDETYITGGVGYQGAVFGFDAAAKRQIQGVGRSWQIMGVLRWNLSRPSPVSEPYF